jgi:acyl-CoA synthetase (AMP-forming)/AMP-acid ligase II
MQSNVLAFFEEGAARQYPNKVAIVDASIQLTFAQLEARSKRLAQVLISRADVLNKAIAVYLPKSAGVIVANLAILYTGNIYSNLDVKSPPQRLKNIIANISPQLVIALPASQRMPSSSLRK